MLVCVPAQEGARTVSGQASCRCSPRRSHDFCYAWLTMAKPTKAVELGSEVTLPSGKRVRITAPADVQRPWLAVESGHVWQVCRPHGQPRVIQTVGGLRAGVRRVHALRIWPMRQVAARRVRHQIGEIASHGLDHSWADVWRPDLRPSLICAAWAGAWC